MLFLALGGEHARVAARAPVPDQRGQSVLIGRYDFLGPAPYDWNIVLSDNPVVLAGLGLPSNAEQGTTYLSPALNRQLDSQHEAAIKRYGIVGTDTIALSALLNSDELLAITLSDRWDIWASDNHALRFSELGVSTDMAPGLLYLRSEPPASTWIVSLMLFVFCPLLLLAVTAARFLSGRRDSRLGLYQSLGAARSTAILGALREQIIATTAGALIGVLLAMVASRTMGRLPVVDYPIPFSDVQLGFVKIALLALVTIGLLALATIVAMPRSPLADTRGSDSGPWKVSAGVVFAVGGAAATLLAVNLGDDAGYLVLVGGTIALSVGLALGTPALIRYGAARIADGMPRSATLLVSLRQTAEPSSRQSHVTGVMTAALFLAATASVHVQTFDQSEEPIEDPRSEAEVIFADGARLSEARLAVPDTYLSLYLSAEDGGTTLLYFPEDLARLGTSATELSKRTPSSTIDLSRYELHPATDDDANTAIVDALYVFADGVPPESFDSEVRDLALASQWTFGLNSPRTNVSGSEVAPQVWGGLGVVVLVGLLLASLIAELIAGSLAQTASLRPLTRLGSSPRWRAGVAASLILIGGVAGTTTAALASVVVSQAYEKVVGPADHAMSTNAWWAVAGISITLVAGGTSGFLALIGDADRDRHHVRSGLLQTPPLKPGSTDFTG